MRKMYRLKITSFFVKIKPVIMDKTKKDALFNLHERF